MREPPRSLDIQNPSAAAERVSVQPVILPPHVLGLRRKLKTATRHTDGLALDDSDRQEYDEDTIFYDVFLDSTNRKLIMLGPPLLNLAERLLPLKVRWNGDALDCRLVEESSLIIAEALVPGPVLELNTLDVCFGSEWSWNGTVPRNNYGSAAQLTLTTLQKDNHIRWIREWIDYFRALHGVDRVILYDNASEYQSRLCNDVSRDVILVPWNFKYGPRRSHANQYCQLGSLNHCRLRFGNMHFALNADIDELLVVNGTTLGELICKKDCVVFDSYWVPFRYSAPDSDYNFRDFLFRKREPRGFAGAKYAFRFAAVRLNGVHSVELGRVSRFPALRLDVGHAYLLHYKGITTNWKRVYYDRLRPEVPNPDDVRLDFGSLWGDLDAGAKHLGRSTI